MRLLASHAPSGHDAYDERVRARSAGEASLSCPHPADSPEREAWLHGWREAGEAGAAAALTS